MALTRATYSMITGAPANAADFGLIGDGNADDTLAMQAFMTAACAVGAGVITDAKTIKITSPLQTSFGAAGVNLDFGGSTIAPYWTLAPNQLVAVVGLNSGSYQANSNVSIRNLRINAVNVPYFESVVGTDLRGISGLIIQNAGCVNIDNYEANDLFFGFGVQLRFFNRSSIRNVKFVNVGSKFRPTVDDASPFDAAGDAVYLGDVMGNGMSVIDNLLAASYPTKYGRAGVVMEDLTGVTTSHKLHIRNAAFSNYQRTIHQEDGGKGRCIWENGSATGFSCAVFNIGGAARVPYYLIKNVSFAVAPPFAYGGTSGLQNFQNDGHSIFEGCDVTYTLDVQERGSYVLRDCSVDLGASVVFWVYGTRYTPMSFYGTKITSTTGGYSTSNWEGLIIDSCTFNGLATSVATVLRIASASFSGFGTPLSISQTQFYNAFCEFVNVVDRNTIKITNCRFVFEGVTTGQSLVPTSSNSRVDYADCHFEAKDIWLRIYGDGSLDNSFYGCNFYNVQLQTINNGGLPNKADTFQAAACRFFYDNNYVPTSPIDTFQAYGGMQACLFVDTTTAQSIVNPLNTALFKTVGTGNLMAKNAGVSVI